MIDFLRPGRGRAHAGFAITDADLERIRIETEGGGNHLPQFTVNIEDEEGELVARATKTHYIKRETG